MPHKTKTRSKREQLFRLLAVSTRRRTALPALAAAVLIGGTTGLVAQQPASVGPLLLNSAASSTPAIPVTRFRIKPFEQSIRESLSENQGERFQETKQLPAATVSPSEMPTHGQAETSVTLTPVTQFDRSSFDRSITNSLSQLQAIHGDASQSSVVQLQAPTTSAAASSPASSPTNAAATGQLPIAHQFSGQFARQTAHPVSQMDADVMSLGHSPTLSSDLGTPVSGMMEAGGFPVTSSLANSANCLAPGFFPSDFSPTPIDAASTYHDGQREAFVYDAKYDVPTQRPLIEWPRKWYTNGITPNGINLFGEKNMVRPKFYMYGDYRTGIIGGRNAAGRTDNWAHRLNLDLDLQITDTERFHMFMGPLDNGNQFTRLELIDGDVEFQEEIDFTPVTGFFEGDLGVLLGATHGKTSPFELPFTAGLIPLLFQNGVWMEDAVTGAAFALPARHSRLLNISNMDTTFFAAVDQINSPAFDGANAAQVFGTATFIEAYGGYIEAGYAFLNDRNNDDRDYHNATVSFTRRYLDRISNSVRVIVNAGQDGPKDARTADGGLLLVENSWISSSPLTVVPYANFFYGWDRPQSVARAAGSGGILRNSGINFDTDGLNGFATLDTSGSDSAGGAIGVDLIGDDLDKQLVIEAAFQTPHGTANPNLPDDQFAIGSRLQFNLTHATLLRFDVMHGWRRGLDDVYGTRLEYRWKF
ncbi:MAG: hypothetical protein WBD20_13815 [Pirellulaceae bacterium]